MANKQGFISNGPPGLTQELRLAFVEEVANSGIFRPTFEEVALGSDAPQAQSGIVAAAGRLCAMDRSVVEGTTTGPTALTATVNGQVNIGTKASANQTWTLPPAQVQGLQFTFVCGNAAGEILVNPSGTDTISIKASEGGANVTTAAGTGIKNTAATNVVNDYITLISDGISQWWMIGQSGTWASQ